MWGDRGDREIRVKRRKKERLRQQPLHKRNNGLEQETIAKTGQVENRRTGNTNIAKVGSAEAFRSQKSKIVRVTSVKQ